MASGAGRRGNKADKVLEYEAFVDKRLKPDLVRAIAERDKLMEQLKTYSDLATNIKMLEENKLARLRTMVNLGSEIYCQADVPDTSRIFVDIGLGFHAELSWKEALDFITTKTTILDRTHERDSNAQANQRGDETCRENQVSNQAGLRRHSRALEFGARVILGESSILIET
ncbi:protein UXT homolog isoform X1 [Selaginella moellendorffii]|uniref:protein UXT homolog isoform X1 n=1 Tax=Selaginella moellendorffii TaxID=88036 RepID=UPI000D1D05F0|nr:protein UXT homolog isoform X1 [Selaginella moellendorffii]|eukprot:XP_024530370.1 protein UXT homolog isoform X1 [Selaginella moellendorffii]